MTAEPEVRLRDALLAFVEGRSDPALQRFKAGLAGWGHQRIAVAPCHLPAAELLAPARAQATAETAALLDLVADAAPALKWEQSYSKADGVVGDDMLAGYGFAELIGTLGPFVSSKVRCGIGIWGPQIDYPDHRHQAEEVYLPLAGRAAFRLDGETAVRGVGEAVYVPSLLVHGFRTFEAPLVLVYIWQSGDLRQKSRFVDG